MTAIHKAISADKPLCNAPSGNVTVTDDRSLVDCDDCKELMQIRLLKSKGKLHMMKTIDEFYEDYKTKKIYRTQSVRGLSDRELCKLLKAWNDEEEGPCIIGIVTGSRVGDNLIFKEYTRMDFFNLIRKLMNDAAKIWTR